MIDFRPLIQPSFWIKTNPTPLTTGGERVIFIVFAIFLVMGAIVRMVAGHRTDDRYVTETFNRLGRLGVTMGIIGLLLFFFTFEQIPFFSGHFWYLLWFIGLVIWLIRIGQYALKIVPAERAAEVARQEKAKYLPKSA